MGALDDLLTGSGSSDVASNPVATPSLDGLLSAAPETPAPSATPGLDSLLQDGRAPELRGPVSTDGSAVPVVNTPPAAPVPAVASYDTQLTPQEEQSFQQWKQKYAPQDSGQDYDLRGAFKKGLTPAANGHWPDTFKKPNHPTFSDQSIYAKDAPEKAGHWNGDVYVPPQQSAVTTALNVDKTTFDMSPVGLAFNSLKKALEIGHTLGTDIAAPDTPEQAARAKLIHDAGNVPDRSSIGTDLQTSWNNLTAGELGRELATTQRQLEQAHGRAPAVQAGRGPSYMGYSDKDVPMLEAKLESLHEAAAEKSRAPRPVENPVYDMASQEGLDRRSAVKATLEGIKTSPWGYLRSSAAQNLASSIPPVVGGIVGAIGGPETAAAGAGLGSYMVEYGSDIESGLADFGADMSDAKSRSKVWKEHGQEIMRRSQNKAAVVAFFDALGGHGAAKLAELPVKGIMARAGQVAGGMGIDAASGMSGEAGGQIANDGRVKDWNAVFQEAIGGFLPGAAMEGGQIAATKLIPKTRRNLPTENELRDLWNESQPDNPISTYKDATNSGRTLYGYAVDDDPSGQVELGTYDEAERKAGSGDFGRGLLIAVSPDQAQKVAPQIAVETVTEGMLNPGSRMPTLDAVRAVNPALAKDVSELTNFYARGEATAEQFSAHMQDLWTQHSKPVFTGPTTGVGITPREDNFLPHDTLKGTSHTLSGAVTYNSYMPYGRGLTKPSASLNLDTLKEDADQQGLLVVPGGVHFRLTGSPGLMTRVDETFNFSNPQAKQEFLQADTQKMSELFATGQVSWKGRLDPRFMIAGANQAADYQEGFQLIRPDGTHLNKIKGEALLNKHTKRYGMNSDLNQSPGDMLSRPLTAAEGLNFPLWQDLEKAMSMPGDVIGYGNSPLMGDMLSWIDKARKLSGMRAKIIFLMPHLVPGVGLATHGWALPQAAHDKFPEIAKNTIDYTQKSPQMVGFFQGAHPEVFYIVIPESADPRREALEKKFGTLAHEFGHAISADRLMTAPLKVQIKLFGAYRRMRAALDPKDRTGSVADTDLIRTRMRGPEATATDEATNYQYFATFEEWIAEQTARWAQSNERAVGFLEKHFKSAFNSVAKMFKDNWMDPKNFEAEPEFVSWMESLANGETGASYSSEAEVNMDRKSLRANARFDASPTPAHENAIDLRSVLDEFGPVSKAFAGSEHKAAVYNAGVTKAVLDKFNWFYKWAANLRQLSEANPHVTELSLARELFQFSKNDTNKIMVNADATLQKWRQLGSKRGRQLSAFLFDLNEMNYLSNLERLTGITRWPTPQEFSDLARKYQLDKESIDVYREVRDFFLATIKREEELKIADAMKITDPTLQAQALAAIKTLSTTLVAKPYFPQMRFGKYSLTVRVQGTGKLEHFELFETKGELRRAAEDALKVWPSAQFDVVSSTLRQELMPFVGMSPWMLEKVREMPGLTTDQLHWIDQLRFALAPSQSFTKHMMKRRNYSGYSTDGRRTFANYAFHHARNYGRVKYSDQFRQVIASLDKSVPPGSLPTDIIQRKAMADFVQHQVNELMNPSQDWAQLRALNAIWHLGFNAKSAVVNMTQVLVTASFLGAKFGGVRAEAALLLASGKLSTFYRKGKYEGTTDLEFQAIDRAMKDGHIDESMAAELAALAVGGGVGTRIGKTLVGDKFLQGYIAFTEKAMWMFQKAEQWQRRVSFRAAYQLAMSNPNTKWLQELQQKHFLQYQQLRAEGWGDRQTLAYLAGVDTIVSTLGVYDKQSRPRYMQGRRSVVFAFQMFTQQNLWMLWNNKDMMLRYMLYMGLMGGSMGMIPDDLKGMFSIMGRIAFGNQFNLEREARKLIVEMMGEDSQIPPDLILHGTARYGFGFPAIARWLGATAVPDVDLSASVTLNRLLPIDPAKMFMPGQKPTDMLASGAETAAGAAYSIPIAILKALAASDMEMTDFKRWEGAVPSALRNVSKAWRMYQEGGERNKNFATTIPFDGDDPEHLGEIIGTALGFRPTRVSQAYDRSTAEREIDIFWETQKQMLMRQAYRDKFVYKDDDAFRLTIAQIKKFNESTFDKKYVITREGLDQSFKSRAKAVVGTEKGLSTSPVTKRAMDKMFPETVVEQKKVK